MDELLARLTQGIDTQAPDAFWKIFFRLWSLVPWTALTVLGVISVAVGALLGWWRGRTTEGVLWALALGPLGWFVVLLRPKAAQPPPLPAAGRHEGHV